MLWPFLLISIWIRTILKFCWLTYVQYKGLQDSSITTISRRIYKQECYIKKCQGHWWRWGRNSIGRSEENWPRIKHGYARLIYCVKWSLYVYMERVKTIWPRLIKQYQWHKPFAGESKRSTNSCISQGIAFISVMRFSSCKICFPVLLYLWK